MISFDFESAMKKLQNDLKAERYIHSIGVMETAQKLAKRFGVDEQKAKIAGILHDCAKNIGVSQSYAMCDMFSIKLDDVSKKSYKLVHQYLGAKLAETEFGITDEEILSAIRFHTTARANMSQIEKVIYLADFIEPNRDKEPFDGLSKLRLLCEKDIDEAMLFALDFSIESVVSRKLLLHIDTALARNWVLDKKMSKTLEK